MTVPKLERTIQATIVLLLAVFVYVIFDSFRERVVVVGESAPENYQRHELDEPEYDQRRGVTAVMLSAQAKKELTTLLGPRGYLDRPEDLLLYEYDGSIDKARPEMVVFPRTTEEVVRIVKITARHKVPIVGRGAGTGLSGGAIPRAGGVTIGFARRNRILEIDLPNERAVVQPGVVNLDITLAVQPQGYFYAPDPSSQRACTIGGNVSENAG